MLGDPDRLGKLGSLLPALANCRAATPFSAR